MIKRIENIENTPVELRQSHYSRIILSHIQTYGTEYDFCELYELRQKGKRAAVFVSFNGSLTADILEGASLGGVSLRETSEFVRFKSPYTVELPEDMTGKTGISGYQRSKRYFYEIPAWNSADGIEIDPDAETVYATAFSGKESSYGLWLTDTVRRKNKDLLRLYSYKSSVLTVKCRSGGMAYIADVATSEADRGKGYARALLGGVAKLMADEGYTSYLAADDLTKGYYDSLGYKLIGTDNIYKIKDSINYEQIL